MQRPVKTWTSVWVQGLWILLLLSQWRPAVLAATSGPLRQGGPNGRYLVDSNGKAVFLSGSHTWNNFEDIGIGSAAQTTNLPSSFINFMVAHGQNATFLWHKDLPHYCNWDSNNWTMAPWPWLRPGPGTASDGQPKFDLTQFNQAYFDRLRTEVQQMQQAGLYAVIQLFDGLQLTNARCGTTAPNGDGFPFTGVNNINGVDDGYTSGSCGVGSVTMTTNNAITNFQDAYVKKVIDTLNDQPNILFEVSEEQPGTSYSSGCQGYGGASEMTFWAPHMMGLIRAYEGGGTFEGTTYSPKPLQHPVGIGGMNYNDRACPEGDCVLYASTATWVGPLINGGAAQFPANVPINNQGKAAINDSDHGLYWTAFINSDGSIQNQNLRGYLWENLTSGAEGVVFMDPYLVSWTNTTPVRNTCTGPITNGICAGVDPKYEPFRNAMGYLQLFANRINLVAMTPQGGLSSTGYCIAHATSTGAEYVVYTPNTNSFTVNLAATTRTLNVEWINPASGAVTAGSPATVRGGSTLTFSSPTGADAALHIWDPGVTSSSPCDTNNDGLVNVVDVQLEVTMALGINPCVNPSGTCNVISVQRVVNAALGGNCVSP